MTTRRGPISPEVCEDAQAFQNRIIAAFVDALPDCTSTPFTFAQRYTILMGALGWILHMVFEQFRSLDRHQANVELAYIITNIIVPSATSDT